jgi:hypothetical protein
VLILQLSTNFILRGITLSTFAAPTLGIGHQVSAHALDRDLITRIRSSVLCIKRADGSVVSNAIVWDYTSSTVLLLTNYHTWDQEFKYCFPLKPKKRKKSNTDDPPVRITLSNDDFQHEFAVTYEVFQSWHKEEDFAVLELPKEGFTMLRIPVSLDVSLTLKVHAFGYIGHTNELNISSGEVSSLIPQGFTLNLLSAGGFSGAAIIADGYGRAIGYMGGNLDASKDKNSQHQSYCYRFDHVITATNRQSTPTKSPSGNGGGKTTK